MEWPARLVLSAGFALGIMIRMASAGGDYSFDVSPDGRRVVFSADDGDLYLFNLQTLQIDRLTNTEEDEGTPAFSPDGGSVAYSAGEKGHQGSRLFVRSLDGKRVRPLTNDADAADFSPSYSSDGQQITFVRSPRLRPASMGGMRWTDFDIYVIQQDGTEPRRVTHENYWTSGSPHFTHDGRGIIFTGSHNNDPHVLLLEVVANGSTPPRPLGASPTVGQARIGAWVSDPSISRDGKRIVFVSDRARPFAYDLYMMNRDGTGVKALGLTVRGGQHPTNSQPVFMPDGTRIVFKSAAKPGDAEGFWQMDTDGKNLHQLADSGLFIDPLHWKAKP